MVAGLLYTVLSLAENARLLTYAFDLGVYYEALRGYAHFGLPLVALKGAHYNLLGDHFEPMVTVLVPTSGSGRTQLSCWSTKPYLWRSP